MTKQTLINLLRQQAGRKSGRRTPNRYVRFDSDQDAEIERLAREADMEIADTIRGLVRIALPDMEAKNNAS